MRKKLRSPFSIPVARPKSVVDLLIIVFGVRGHYVVNELKKRKSLTFPTKASQTQRKITALAEIVVRDTFLEWEGEHEFQNRGWGHGTSRIDLSSGSASVISYLSNETVRRLSGP